MTDFDAAKALKEQIAALLEIRTSMLRRERQLQIQYGEVEVEYHSVVKLRGFADMELEKAREALKALEAPEMPKGNPIEPQPTGEN